MLSGSGNGFKKSKATSVGYAWIGMQEDIVDPTEYGGRNSDSQSQGESCDQSEPGIRDQQFEAEVEVLAQSLRKGLRE